MLECISPDQQIDPDQANELMQQFAALGYIEDPSADKEKQAESAEIEAKYNVARTYFWKNRPDQSTAATRRDRSASSLGRSVSRISWRLVIFKAGYLRQAERVFLAIADGAEPDTASRC